MRHYWLQSLREVVLVRKSVSWHQNLEKVLPVWMQDPTAASLHAQCDQQQATVGTTTGCGTSDPALMRICALLRMLAACTPGDDDAETRLYAGAGRLEGALLDVAPTHMRLESFPGALRPGTPLSVSVHLYNGLGQPVQRDTLSFTVTVNIEPADRVLSTIAVDPNSGTHLCPDPQRPWQDASIAFLDARAATGGSLTAPVRGGLATWPFLTAHGWPGRYVLVFTAKAVEDEDLYQIAPLRVAVDLLHCQEGEALDTSWAQQPGAQPSWLACSRCTRGRFTLWRDNRPTLWEIDSSDYKAVMRKTANSEAEGNAGCMPCPSHATCLGGAVLVPEPGYWHSAPDSTLFHRCPKGDACGEAESHDSWASMPSASPADLQVNVSGNGTITLANTTIGSGISSAGSTISTLVAEQASSSALDTRSGWLSLCQELGYQARASYILSNSSDSLAQNTSLATTADISSLTELVAACTAWGASAVTLATSPYLQLECATGYTSHLCAACTPGYFINAEFECRQCPASGLNTGIAVLAFLGSVALVLFTSFMNLMDNDALTEGEEDDGGEPASEYLKVAIVHAQFYIIITRLPVAYPDVISRLSGAVSALMGAESTVAFSYSCMFPEQASDGQAKAQLLGALIVPAVVVTTSLGIWVVRYVFFNQAQLRRITVMRASASGASRGSKSSGGRSAAAAAAAAVAAAMSARTDAENAPDVLDPPEDEPNDEDDGDRESNPTTLPVRTSFPAGKVEVEESIPDKRERPLFSRQATREAVVRAWRSLSGSLKRSAFGRALARLDELLTLRRQLGIITVFSVFILYPGWAQAALSIFACYRVDDGTSGPFPDRQQATWRNGYWIRNMAQECYTGTHLRLYVPIGIVAVLLVCLAPPLASFLLLWHHRERLDQPNVQRRYGFLYSRYRPAYFWWESVLMLEELALVAVEVFGRALPVVSHQVLLMLAAFIVLSLINMACAPVRSRQVLLLEFLSLGVLSLTVTLSLYFVVGDLGLTEANLVGLIVLTINVLLMAGFLVMLLRSGWATIHSKGTKLARGLQRGFTYLASRRQRTTSSAGGSGAARSGGRGKGSWRLGSQKSTASSQLPSLRHNLAALSITSQNGGSVDVAKEPVSPIGARSPTCDSTIGISVVIAVEQVNSGPNE